jgi:glycosyltransferase involved in cell wall biosynthesis
MRIAFATIYDLRDVSRGSGTFFNLASELARQGHQVIGLGPFDFEFPMISRVLRALHRLAGKRQPAFLDPFVSRLLGKQVSEALKGLEYDVFLTNDMAMAAFTKSCAPIVLYTDVMITRAYKEQHLATSRLSGLSIVSLSFARWIIRRALRKTQLAVFPAEWAAREARGYASEHDKIRVVPFGANVDDPGPSIAANRRFQDVLNRGRLELLFVGKDWQHKGGPIAVEIVDLLNQNGRSSRLHIVGARPVGVNSSESIRLYGLLDKRKANQAELLQKLFMECDVLILPSSREGFVIAVLEASAFGMPVLAFDVDGVKGAVLNGETGSLLPFEGGAQSFVVAIDRWFKDSNIYDAMVIASRRHFESSVNWRSSVMRLVALMKSTIEAGKAGSFQ